MRKKNTHQELSEDYGALLKYERRLGAISAITQFSLTLFANAWMNLEYPFYKVVAPIVLGICLYQLIKDLLTFFNVDSRRVELILKGIELEQKDDSLKRCFQDELKTFNFTNAMFVRATVWFFSFGCLTYFFSQHIPDVSSNFSINLLGAAAFSGVFTTIVSLKFYATLKLLKDAKGPDAPTIQKDKSAPEKFHHTEIHRSQAMEYKKLAAAFKRNNMLGAIEMLATLGPLYLISKGNAAYSKSLGILFACLAVIFMARDYSRSKRSDKKIAELVESGIELERKKPSFDRFFHQILSQFPIVKILALRSLYTVVCVYSLSAFLNKTLFEKEGYGDSKIAIGVIGAVVGITTIFLYYGSFKKLDQLKEMKRREAGS